MKNLSIRECDIVPEESLTARQEVIARLASLQSLNRTLIPISDGLDMSKIGARLITRRGAEIDYLNRQAEAWANLTAQERGLYQAFCSLKL